MTEYSCSSLSRWVAANKGRGLPEIVFPRLSNTDLRDLAGGIMTSTLGDAWSLAAFDLLSLFSRKLDRP